MLISFAAFGLVYIMVGMAMRPLIESFLRDHGVVRNNYAGETIPTGAGLFLYFMLLSAQMVITIWPYGIGRFYGTVIPTYGPSFTQYLVWMGVVFFAGWVDDTRGDRKVKGLRGHLGRFVKDGVMTSGLVKACATVVVAGWVTVQSDWVWYEASVRFAVIVLCTNAVNLLDLRPGRAIKSFYIGTIPLFVWSETRLFMPYWLPLAMAALIALPRDLKGRAMLGDTGANMLGFGLGFCLAVAAPIQVLLPVALFLALLHWTAERSSLTVIIERNPLLNRIDRWGRVR